ncbi:hypothetical protein PPK15_gp86 [Bacillus phage 000TH010]|uniref:Uncharacterized protein n=1 Tax=Bacillus phage 000TH010 TaxID=2601652 RepID=A0A5P8PI02_9CAUD|nr:hypothetical protein PPK15_gp86 [Bacillus phage 000TH010]QFR56299.1 hypothetical protein 000TH010_86 [Bacillus phage 000TH010]
MNLEFEEVLIIVCVLLAGLLIVGTVLEHKDCAKSGGKMEGTGNYTTTWASVGNGTMVPVTSEEMECRK